MIAIFSCPSSVHALQIEFSFYGNWEVEVGLDFPHFPSVASLYLKPHTDRGHGYPWLHWILPHTPNVHSLTIDVSDPFYEEASVFELNPSMGNIYLPSLTSLRIIRHSTDAENSATAAAAKHWHETLVAVLRNRAQSEDTLKIDSLQISGNDRVMSVDCMRDYLLYVDRVHWEREDVDGRHISNIGMLAKDLPEVVVYESAEVSSWGPRIEPLWKGFQV